MLNSRGMSSTGALGRTLGTGPGTAGATSLAPSCAAVASRRAHRRRDPRFPGVYHLHPPASLAVQQAPEELGQPEATVSGGQASSALFFADFSTRVALERLYQLREAGSGAQGIVEDGAVMRVVPTESERKTSRTKNAERTPDYFANVGDAIRTLREDIPELFNRELNYSIYRDDVVFKDPRNKFEGIKNYKLIFWSLRFHGRIFFSKLYVEVKRIWQPSDDVIKMRWTVHGIPRVPWEAEGLFDGISTYKLDNAGRVYEHCVDNVLLRDPPMLTNPPLLAGLNLVPGGPVPQQAPYPGAWGASSACVAATTEPVEANKATAAVVEPGGHGATTTGNASVKPLLFLGGLWGLVSPPSARTAGATRKPSPSVHLPAPDTSSAASQVPVVAPAAAAAPPSQLWLRADVLSRFSWVRLYAALLASVSILGSSAAGQRLPPLDPSPSH